MPKEIIADCDFEQCFLTWIGLYMYQPYNDQETKSSKIDLETKGSKIVYKYKECWAKKMTQFNTFGTHKNNKWIAS